MKTIERILKSKGQFVRVAWKSEPKPKAEFKGIKLEKISRAIARAGINYSNLKENEGIETGELPWGKWKNFPYVIEHKEKEYIRLYPVSRKRPMVKTKFFVDGKSVEKNEFEKYLPPSATNKETPKCFNVSAENFIE